MEIRKTDEGPMDIHVKKKGTLHVRRQNAKEPEKEGSRKETGKQERTKQFTDGQGNGKEGIGNKESRKKASAAKGMVIRKKLIVPDADFSAVARTALDEMDSGEEADQADRAADGPAGSAFCTIRVGRKEIGKKEGRQGVSVSKEIMVKKKPAIPGAAFSAAARTALDEMDGGEELYRAYRAARVPVGAVSNAVRIGRNRFRSKAAGEKRLKIRKRQSGSRIREKNVRETTGKKNAQTAGGGKENRIVEAVMGADARGMPAGTVDGKRGRKNPARNRMIRLFAAKLSQEEKQGGIGGAVKEVAAIRFFTAAKKVLRYAGMFLSVPFALVALLVLPVIAVLAVIYNSPLAIFFPSISSGETTQEVLSAYVSEFNQRIGEELAVHPGCDTARKTYAGFEGVEEPDNFSDILAVYMVKYGNGDTATDMTDAAKANLKAVFEDMRSYSVTEEPETVEHEDGRTETSTVKKVNVELKTCRDMITVCGFDEEEQAMLEELMKPEYRAAISPDGTSGGMGTGEMIGAEKYQAILDAVSDENGKQVVAFALSKVGYPYSQAYRNSGRYYDCSSLAYYAWKAAGVDISYGGANTAAAEARYCYENQYLVSFGEMQPGDLIFYSYGSNGRFMDITHVAVYVGDGNVVEAVSEQVGVVFRAVPTGSIVFIGRPRG